jgi:hypothetical protein
VASHGVRHVTRARTTQVTKYREHLTIRVA